MQLSTEARNTFFIKKKKMLPDRLMPAFTAITLNSLISDTIRSRKSVLKHIKMEIKQSLIDSLIEDVGYLEHEAEALKYVIESVPYTENTSSGMSIIETLALVDHQQQQFYRAVIEEVIQSVRPINLNMFANPEETFELDSELANDIQKVLYKISKHRVALLTLIKNIKLIDWEREITSGKTTLTLYEFVRQMVQKERAIFKNIANMVLAYQNGSDAGHQIKNQTS